jgi:hypothetical protein
MGRRRRWPAVAVLGATLLAGCGGQTTGPADSAPPTAAPSTSPTPDAGGLPPAPQGVPDADDPLGRPRAVEVPPVWDEASRAAARELALAVMSAFVATDGTADQWWDGLSVLLSPQAQMDYSFVDPENVPARAVTGDPVLVDESSAYIAYVEVSTDVGNYTVILSRIDANAPWVGERITPPEGVN